ncbi:MAG: hypothetical protein EOO80_22560, partial [Oxalobacteraceae bacterium]
MTYLRCSLRKSHISNEDRSRLSPRPIPHSRFPIQKTGTPLAKPIPSSSGSGPMRLLLLVIL